MSGLAETATPLFAAVEPFFAIAFTAFGAAITWLELVDFALAAAMVVHNIRVNVLG